MKRLSPPLLLALALLTSPAARADSGRWRVLSVRPSDGTIGGPRDVVVYTPRNKPTHAIYAQDGQNVFELGANKGGWKLDKAAEAVGGTLHSALVVAIPSGLGGEARYFEALGLSYPGDAHRNRMFSAYERFVTHDVRNALAQEFPSLPDSAASRALIGASFAGGASLFIGLRNPDVFGNVAVMSAGHNRSIDYLSEHLAQLAAARRAPAARGPLAVVRSRFILIAGFGDDHERGNWGKMDWARRLLEEHGLKDVVLVKDPHGGHEEPAWAGQAPHVLRHLFSQAEPRDRASWPADWEIR